MTRLHDGLSVLALGGFIAACSASSASSPAGNGGGGGTPGTGATTATGGLGGSGGSTGGSAGTGGGAGTGGTAGVGGSGGTSGCSTDADCPGVDTTCRRRTCTTGSCGFLDASPGVACAETGGSVCDGAGNCVECNVTADCNSGGVCASNQCVAAACTDKQKNGSETDVDCGGSCAPCANTKQCATVADCESGYCNAGVCAACTADGQCASGGYCDSGKCAPKKTAGSVCGAAKECQSGFCPSPDGVCCGSACASTCQACVQGKTGVANGTCAPVTKGSDPDTECKSTAASTCGVDGTGCNGSATAPACNLYPSGTLCAGAVCSAGNSTAAATCNGTGACLVPTAKACSPYTCNTAGTACLTSCSIDANCAAGGICVGGSCTSKLANGATCSSGSQCTSGNCIDGVCCNSTCGGACDACNLAGKLGTCSPVAAGQPGSPSCAPFSCNGTSTTCPTSCTTTAECVSGECMGGQCLQKCFARNDDTTIQSLIDNANVFGLPFTPTATWNVRRIEIFTGNGPGSGQANIALRADAAGQPGTTLASGAFTVTAANGWQGVNIPLTVLSTGTQYWFYYAGADGTWFPIGGSTNQTHWWSSNGTSWSGPSTAYPWKFRLWCQ